MATKITLLNYEEFMVDYLDGNLAEPQLSELLHFLELHPHLKVELDELSSMQLQLNDDLVFENKASLYKHENSITGSVHDDKLIALLENDLPKTEASDLLSQIQNNAELALSWNLYSKTKLKPDLAVVFPEKKMLKRRGAAVYTLQNSLYVAAAGVALFFSLQFLYKQSNDFQYSKPLQFAYIPAPKVGFIPMQQNIANSPIQSVITSVNEKQVTVQAVNNEFESVAYIQPTSVGLKSDEVEFSGIDIKPFAFTPMAADLAFEPSDEYKTIDRYIVDRMKEEAGFKPNEKLSFWKIAERSINGIARYTGASMQMSNTYTEEGKVNSIQFSSAVFGYESRMSN